MSTRANLQIDQGTDVVYQINILDDNGNNILSDFHYDLKAQIRRDYTSEGFAQFNTELNETANAIIMTMTPDQTSNIKSGRYVWDMLLIDTTANVVYRVVEGQVNISPQVTRL